jgi:hypothetical protein
MKNVCQGIGAVATMALILAMGAAASAMGTVNIHHIDGTASSYPGVRVAIVGKTLRLRSPDHQGTLIVERAACSHQDAILMCLPTSVMLRQHGASRPIPIASGTIYFNFTGQRQPLTYSTQHLRSHGILLSLRTERGTLINLDGTVESGVPQ